MKKRKSKPEVFWAIKGDNGFYSGSWLTRSAARNEHARLVQHNMETYADCWKRRRKAYGDRAVKVHMIEAK